MNLKKLRKINKKGLTKGKEHDMIQSDSIKIIQKGAKRSHANGRTIQYYLVRTVC